MSPRSLSHRSRNGGCRRRGSSTPPTSISRPAPASTGRAPDPDGLDDPIATPAQRELFRILRGIDGGSSCFALPERLPAPDPISLELLALAGRARVARDDATATEPTLDTSGPRRRLVRTFLERTLPERVLPRTGSTPGRPDRTSSPAQR